MTQFASFREYYTEAYIQYAARVSALTQEAVTDLGTFRPTAVRAIRAELALQQSMDTWCLEHPDGNLRDVYRTQSREIASHLRRLEEFTDARSEDPIGPDELIHLAASLGTVAVVMGPFRDLRLAAALDAGLD